MDTDHGNSHGPDGHDSDTEIELAIDPAPATAPAAAAAAATTTASSTTSPAPPAPFAAPPAPEMVNDLQHISQLVATGAVVGALPPISMTAAEKRRLVEASLAERRAAKATHAAGATDDSDYSSSEYESDDDGGPSGKPMDAEEHARMKAELDEFMGVNTAAAAQAGDDDDDESSSEEDSDSDLDDLFARTGMEFMDDSDDEGAAGGAGGGGVIMSTHEQPLPPVTQPPMARLPDDIGLVVAGEVVSWMKERAVEAWIAKQEEVKEEAKEEVNMEEAKAENEKEGTAEAPAPGATDEASNITTTTKADPALSPSKPTTSIPKFNSAGTLVIRAIQAPGEGWLESGSVLCLSDRRILGTVCETFGPLTSPFYSLRLPPPPYPYPSAADLAPGTRISYPAAPAYRTFVDMVAVRDPRFASDASNVYDEEVGDDELEWSDDEAEAASKRKRKMAGKKGRAGSRAPSMTPTMGGGHPLPPRPHFDYAGDAHDEDDMMVGALHSGAGDQGGDAWERGSDAGSAMSTASTRALVSYDDVAGPGAPTRGGRGGRGGGGGRGQRGGQRGGRGQGRQQQQRQQHNQYPQQQQQQQQQHDLPTRPQAWGAQEGAAGYTPYMPAGYSPQQPGLGMQGMPMSGGPPPGFGAMPMGGGMPMGGMPMGGMQMPMQMGMPMMGMPMGYSAPQGGAGEAANAPAINPRFAAQYAQQHQQHQQQHQQQYAPQGGYWPQQGGQQGGYGGQGQGYSE